MRKCRGFPCWRATNIGMVGLVPLALLITMIGLMGGSAELRADELGQASESKIEIKITGGVDAAEREQIDQLVQSFEEKNQSPSLKIETKNLGTDGKGKEGGEKRDNGKGDEKKESKAEKYLFYPLTAIMLGAVVAFTVLSQGWRKAKHGINPVGNAATAVAFGIVAASGLLLIFEVKLKDSGVDVKFWHVVTGTVFIYLILFHVVNNWRAWLSYGRRFVRSARGQR